MGPSSLLLFVSPVLRQGEHPGSKILAELPTDPASVFVVLILLGSAAAVLWFGRSEGPPR